MSSTSSLDESAYSWGSNNSIGMITILASISLSVTMVTKHIFCYNIFPWFFPWFIFGFHYIIVLAFYNYVCISLRFLSMRHIVTGFFSTTSNTIISDSRVVDHIVPIYWKIQYNSVFAQLNSCTYTVLVKSRSREIDTWSGPIWLRFCMRVWRVSTKPLAKSQPNLVIPSIHLVVLRLYENWRVCNCNV